MYQKPLKFSEVLDEQIKSVIDDYLKVPLNDAATNSPAMPGKS